MVVKKPGESEVTGRSSKEAESAGKKEKTINISRTNVDEIKGDSITMCQVTARSVQGEKLLMRQGGIGRAQTRQLNMVQGGAGVIQAEKADLSTSSSVLILSGGDVNMDQSGSKFLLSRGNISMDQSGVIAMAAKRIEVKNSSTVLMIAQNVEGSVNTMFGPRESLIFGAAAGLVAGLFYLFGRGK
ncbi:MAG: hypothetical protein KAT47_02400 [Candidatus Aegiribacteria sp.]|nr:hypothetical protein [Candidatus Aegiribacteria sp.]